VSKTSPQYLDNRKCAALSGTSGLGQLQTLAVQQTADLFDRLVRAEEERLGDRQPHRLGCLEVDDKVKLCRKLDGQIAHLSTAQETVDVGCRALTHINQVCCVASV
jgi:hypothetical protein